jgi:hypothetical protein
MLMAGTTLLIHCAAEPEVVAVLDAGAPDASTVKRDAGARDGASAPDASGLSPNATEGGGARFEAQYDELKFEDGATVRTFTGFYDKVLGTVCNVGSAGRDKFYCLPHVFPGADFTYYTDASCTRLAVVHRKWWPYTVADLGTSECEHRYFKKGAATVDGIAYRRDASGECFAGLVESDDGVYPVAPIADTALGEFTLEDDTRAFPEERSGSRLVLQHERLTHADGSFVARTPLIYDKVFASLGMDATASDGVRRFLPGYNGGMLGAYATDACDASDTVALLSMRHVRDACTTRRSRYAGWTSPFVNNGCVQRNFRPKPSTPPIANWYEQRSGVCMRASDDVLTSYEAFPGSVAATPFTAPTELVELRHRWTSSAFEATSGTRLDARSDVTESADGLSVRARRWQLFLKINGTPCTPTLRGPSGVARCRPDENTAPPFFEYYADSACTQKTTGYLPAPRCADTPRSTVYVMSPTTPHPIFRYPTAFGKRDALWQKLGAQCVSVTPTGGADYFDLASLSLVPESEFPRVVSGMLRP